MKKCYALLWTWVCLVTISFAQAPVTPLFQDENLLSFTLETNLQTFLDDRGGDPDYHDAVLSYTDEKGEIQSTQVEIKARGRYRRDKLVCYFPPIRMKFPKKEDHPPLFEGQHKLKVVTHCQDQEYILREYYLYKVYNLLTDKSFKVRLAKIRYIDTEESLPDEESYAFFIEDENDMAARNNGAPLDESISLGNNDVDRDLLTITHIFNFMIANKDFGLNVRQNLKVITNQDGKPIVVPYDFDWAGIVDASYTKLTSSKKAAYYERQRFLPLCRTEEEFQQAFDLYEAKKDEIFALYENSPYLSEETVKETLRYFKDFYKTIQKSKKVEEIFINSCNE